jgi:hypothetical protein
MLTTESMLSAKIFSRFKTSSNTEQLSTLCHRLLHQQQESWRLLAENYVSFNAVQTRDVDCGTFQVRLQFNPQRITSTGADVAAHTIRNRKCFLCVEYLPELQKGVLYQNKFLILCNPVPIFQQHFTVSSIQHIPQSLENNLESFLSLAKDLSPDFSIFYNGPKCGASAPDHLHFQVSPANAIPVEHDAVDTNHKNIVVQFDQVTVSTINNYGRSVLVIESKNKGKLIAFFRLLLHLWQNIVHETEEPKLNLIAAYHNDTWRLIMFPRQKHRPEIFFKEEHERVIISPATVDMGGLIVTPREQDFLHTDAERIQSIYREVSVDDDFLPTLIKHVQAI